jgi:hypothetical protein
MFYSLILLKIYGEFIKNIKMLILKLSWWYSLLFCPVHIGPFYASQSGVENFSWLPIIICLLFRELNFCGIRPMYFGLVVLESCCVMGVYLCTLTWTQSWCRWPWSYCVQSRTVLMFVVILTTSYLLCPVGLFVVLLCVLTVYAVDGPVVLGVCCVSCYDVSPLLLAVGWIVCLISSVVCWYGWVARGWLMGLSWREYSICLLY